MRGDAVRQAFARARRQVGMPGFRFHDLRHTGRTLGHLRWRDTQGPDEAARPHLARFRLAVPAAIDGRDAEIASALSDLAAHGNAARLPKSIVVWH